MKVCIIQPAYSQDFSKSDEYFAAQEELLNKCDESMDIIVLPESADMPCYTPDYNSYHASVEKYCDRIIKLAQSTARRCKSMLFISAHSKEETGLRNTTFAIDRGGNIIGKYFKQHLVPNEITKAKLDCGYTYESSEPTVIEMEGIRFGFLTCYDFYFYENYSNLARQKLDVIIGCSHQRSDMHSALETITKFLAYNTNTYVLRASVSMGDNSPLGGCSMIVSPDGTIIENMKSRVGMATAEIDITKKYYKPAGFNNPPAAHYEYIEKGRRPWKYRPAGSAICLPDSVMPYPRTCAHRGFNTIAPDNSMPAFGAAVAMGADEIEFDLWYTKDGEIVSLHDPTLERVSTGCGNVWEHTYDELTKFDFGIKYGEKFKGMKILKFEDILKKFARHCVMNIHIKTKDNNCEYKKEYLDKIVALINKYDCREYVYFMTGNSPLLAMAQKYYPDICRCAGAGDNPWEIVDTAIKYNCKKVQLFKPYFNEEMIKKAHDNGIICNVFYADEEEEAQRYLDMGISTILTNDYNIISQTVKSM